MWGGGWGVNCAAVCALTGIVRTDCRRRRPVPCDIDGVTDTGAATLCISRGTGNDAITTCIFISRITRTRNHGAAGVGGGPLRFVSGGNL